MGKRLALGLFVLSLVTYNLNLRWKPYGDTVPATLLPFAVLLDHTVTLDRYAGWYAERLTGETYWFTSSRGHVYSSYPIAAALLVTPLYVPPVILFRVHEWPVDRVVAAAEGMEKLVASLVAALSVAVYYAFLRRLVGVRAALLLTLLFAFGTETWAISSQALWQHGPGVLLLVGSLYFFHAAATGQRPVAGPLLAGLLAGLSAAVRPTNALFLLACVAAMLLARWRPRQLLLYLVCPLLIGAAVAGYNLYVFGQIRGYYVHSFSGDFLTGLAGLLVSPSRGLFVFTPVVLFVPLGVWAHFRGGQVLCPPVYTASLLFVAAQVLLLSGWFMWHGGFCYGPRLLTELFPCLLVLLAPALDLVSRRVWLKVAFAFMGLLSVGVQAVGAFCYPKGEWDALPVPAHEDVSRFWNWKDNQIVRTLRGGPDLEPYRRLRQARPDTILCWQRGFLVLEGTPAHHWRWCAAEGRVGLINLSGRPKAVRVRAACRTGFDALAWLRIDGPSFTERLQVSARQGELARTFTLPPGEHVLTFTCDAPPRPVPPGNPVMVFRVENFTLEEVKGAPPGPEPRLAVRPGG